ncbi:hypothetical protein B0H21DRAFT_837971 [Amylocystis lapponica]|nr:hypothetical protein B0H21DRAFT_837971 [Amylocystis lapponica]
MSRTTSILDLPNELLLHVKKYIPDADLRTHVCYYRTCARFAGLYGDKDAQEPFWKNACRLAGLGLIKDEQEDTVSWTDIAIDCIARDGFCKHPHLLLRNHPIASRSLATFPAMETMVISTIAGHDIPDVVRPSGVTVWDVQVNIQSVLDIQLHVSDLNTFLLPMIEDFNPLDWDIQTVLKSMETLRNAFEQIRWSGLEWDRGPYGVDSFFVVFLEAEDRDFSRWKRFM